MRKCYFLIVLTGNKNKNLEHLKKQNYIIPQSVLRKKNDYFGLNIENLSNLLC